MCDGVYDDVCDVVCDVVWGVEGGGKVKWLILCCLGVLLSDGVTDIGDCIETPLLLKTNSLSIKILKCVIALLSI